MSLGEGEPTLGTKLETMTGCRARWWGNLPIPMLIVFLLATFLALGERGRALESQNLPENPQPQSEPTADQNQPQDNQGQENQTPASGQQPGGQTPSDPASQTAEKPPAGKKDDSSTPAKTMGATQAALVQLRDWETEFLVGAYVSRNRKLVTLTGKQRRELYLQQVVLTPGAYLKRAFDAGFDQARGVPRQWDDGVPGYMERWWSREGQFIAANSLAALGDAKLGYEPRYDQCRCRGFGPRMRHAFLRNFVTYDRSERYWRPQWALYGGAFGGGMIATAWKPKPLNVFGQGAYGMVGQAGWGILANFFTEFAVDINRKLGAKP